MDLATKSHRSQLLLLPMRGSVPAIRRSMLPRCFQKMMSVHAESIGTKS